MTEIVVEKKTLREWREQTGLSQSELGELAGCGRAAVNNVEQGGYRPDHPAARQIAAALDLRVEQILKGERKQREIDTSRWPDDGFSETTPRQDVRWWRERRALSKADLAQLAGVNGRYVGMLERGVYTAVSPATKRALADALRVAPDKLILPGDETKPSSERSTETLLRAELRGARHALKKARDFMRNDAAITFRHQDARDAILPDIEREVRGL